MSDKSELKAELERKKQRLAQIREEKKRKEEERKKKELDGRKEGASPPQEDSDLERKRREAEALLQSMGIVDASMGKMSRKQLVQPLRVVTEDSCLFHYLVPPPMSPSAKSVGSETGSQDSGDGGTGPRTLHWDSDPSTLLLHSDSQLGRGPLKLGMSKVTQVDFPPKELVSYTKETQTPTQTHPREEEEEEEDLAVVESVPQAQEEKETPKLEEEVSHELTEEEKQQILHSDEFMSFFDHSSRIMERALSEQVDVFFDYSGRDLQDKEGDSQAGAKLSLNRQFADDRWSKHRVVTSLDWSPQYPELLVASYSSNEEAPHEPDGVALVWNMKYKKTTPEYVFHCQSAVMSAAFAQFHPNLVVGGTYSGQIVLWDNRSNKHTPVQRTPLSASAHTDSLELVFKQSKSVAVTSMSFPLGDVNNFVVGSEDGSIFEGHHGPITGLDCHSAAGAVDFSQLFLTSSFDWTIKLWSTKNNKPLYSFEDNSDYLYDVMWSPTHPALFACVDGVGHLDLWNLNNETEVPTASVTVEGNPALNRVRWAQSGREVAVGDSEGQLHIYDVGEQISVPRQDEWTRFVRTLTEINENREDVEELAAQRLAA
ncbi:hypothetical protein DNTS_001960 [Danionella cerebrum]|uniref:Uncharacterized protein n=1 Tax=Danionella cerebrum TaxID=2873325 RepID=A0A553PIN2_9TELE|nr:hypothetical protein DNTS_001960 [Danionella translucida]